MFRIGQKVTPIHVHVPWGYNGNVPKVGTVYTVGWIGLHWSDKQLIDLVEAPSPGSASFSRGYSAECFRPVVERKTDISIFQAMLTPSPVMVDAMKLADHAREIVG